MIKDGQHRYDGTQYNCFFCMKNKTNCRAVVLPAGVSTGIGPFDKLLHQHEGTQYPACQECWAKGQFFLVETVCDMTTDRTFAQRCGFKFLHADEFFAK